MISLSDGPLCLLAYEGHSSVTRIFSSPLFRYLVLIFFWIVLRAATKRASSRRAFVTITLFAVLWCFLAWRWDPRAAIPDSEAYGRYAQAIFLSYPFVILFACILFLRLVVRVMRVEYAGMEAGRNETSSDVLRSLDDFVPVGATLIMITILAVGHWIAGVAAIEQHEKVIETGWMGPLPRNELFVHTIESDAFWLFVMMPVGYAVLLVGCKGQRDRVALLLWALWWAYALFGAPWAHRDDWWMARYVMDVDRCVFELGQVGFYFLNSPLIPPNDGPNFASLVLIFTPGYTIAFAIMLARIVRRWRRPGRHCIRCDYDLTGLESNRCPECFTRFSPRGPRMGPSSAGCVL